MKYSNEAQKWFDEILNFWHLKIGMSNCQNKFELRKNFQYFLKHKRYTKDSYV